MAASSFHQRALARPSQPGDEIVGLALDVARGLATVDDLAHLPVEAQAAWARQARPVLVDLLAALDRTGGDR